MILQDGWYEILATYQQRGENKMGTFPLQVINGAPRVVLEFMVQFDETDRQVKHSLPVAFQDIQKGSPLFGAEYMYQGALTIPDEVELSPEDNQDD